VVGVAFGGHDVTEGLAGDRTTDIVETDLDASVTTAHEHVMASEH
jgi:hypothetical protein